MRDPLDTTTRRQDAKKREPAGLRGGACGKKTSSRQPLRYSTRVFTRSNAFNDNHSVINNDFNDCKHEDVNNNAVQLDYTSVNHSGKAKAAAKKSKKKAMKKVRFGATELIEILPAVVEEDESDDVHPPVWILGQVGEEETRMLLDSGAGTSLIRQDIADRFELKPLPYTGPDVIGVARVKVRPVAKVKVAVSLGGYTRHITAAVVNDLPAPVIIGVPALYEFKANFDFSFYPVRVEIDGKTIDALVDPYRATCKLRAAANYTIPENARRRLRVRHDVRNVNETFTCYISADPLYKSKHGLYVIPGVQNVTSDVVTFIDVINPFPYAVRLPVETCIAMGEMVAPDEDVIEEAEFQVAAEVDDNSRENNASFMGAILAAMNAIEDDPFEDASYSLKEVELGAKLTPVQREAIKAVLRKHKALFDKNRFGFVDAIRHDIDTGDAQPFKTQPKRLRGELRYEVKRQIEELMRLGLIRKSRSPWSSRIVLARKSDKTWRMAIDYRKLNSVTKRNNYPLPRIDEMMDACAGARYFSTVDLAKGFHQQALSGRSIEKTAFVHQTGTYEFLRVPFGLKNAPSYFQELLDATLAELLFGCALVYIDDVAIITKTTFEEHVKDIDRVLSKLENAGFTLKGAKCSFVKNEVDYLGHTYVPPHGFKPNEDKIAVVRDWPAPSTLSEVRNFLGLTGYYRKFIRSYADIAEPLFELARTPAEAVKARQTKKKVDETKEKKRKSESCFNALWS